MHAAEREPLIPSQSPDPSVPIAAMGASMPDPVVTRQPVKNEHVKIESTKAFVEVRAALESLVPQLDARIFVLLQYGESDRARAGLSAASASLTSRGCSPVPSAPAPCSISAPR